MSKKLFSVFSVDVIENCPRCNRDHIIKSFGFYENVESLKEDIKNKCSSWRDEDIECIVEFRVYHHRGRKNLCNNKIEAERFQLEDINLKKK